MSYPSNPTDPFAPPGPQPAQPPQAAQNPQAWAPVHQPGYAVPSPPGAPHQPFASGPPQQQPFGPAPKGGNGLAITAVILSGLSLLGVLLLAVFVLGPILGGSHYVLYGEVRPTNQVVTDVDLQDAISQALDDEGSIADELVCPAESKVGQGLVTVCHGSVDDFDWTGIVVFEDDEGSFIVTEY